MSDPTAFRDEPVVTLNELPYLDVSRHPCLPSSTLYSDCETAFAVIVQAVDGGAVEANQRAVFPWYAFTSFLRDQIDECLCDRVSISPDRCDVLALCLQNVADQLTGSVVLRLGDVSNGCIPLPQLVPRGEHEFLMDPHVVLNRFEHIVGR